MLFDERLVAAQRTELDRQAGRAGAYGSRDDVKQALRSRRRARPTFKRFGEMRAVARIRQVARQRLGSRLPTASVVDAMASTESAATVLPAPISEGS